MHPDIQSYNSVQTPEDESICSSLAIIIDKGLPQAESKIWHGHPVWFLEGNPIVGYSKQKPGIRLMFWSGADFEEEELIVRAGKFKDASKFYTTETEIMEEEIMRWLHKSEAIQWDYKNIVKRKGVLERLK
jgi:hypothetical protein